MSLIKNFTISDYQENDCVIQTHNDQWVIPNNCELLKLLLKQQGLNAEDLCFGSKLQCQSFIKKLFLLALEDEVKTNTPSTLAKFARDLVRLEHQSRN